MSRLTIRNFSASDIGPWLDYWYSAPVPYLESIGVDVSRLPARSVFESFLKAHIAENATRKKSQLQAVTVEWALRAIGAHTITDVRPGESGVLHAHYWNEGDRGRGLGTCSYLLASSLFMARFGLKEILFKTPKSNIPANRIKEKLAIPKIGEMILDSPIARPNVLTNVYSLTKDHLDLLLKQTTIP